jgi:hypothetical protein
MSHASRLALGLSLLTLSPLAHAQWSQTSGPKGWQIQDIVSIGSTLYAGTMWGGTVFVSTDGGVGWRSASSGLPAGGNGLLFLGKVGTALFAGTNEGLFRSVDGGSSWSGVKTGLAESSSGWYWSYDIAPLGSRVFLAGQDGVYESRDGGIHWFASNQEPPYTQGSSGGGRFAAADTFLFFGGRHGLFRTSLNSTAWTPINLGVPDTIVSSIAFVGNSLLVSARPKNSGPLQTVLRSTDIGTTWTHADDGLPDTLYGTLKSIESDLYQIEWGRTYRSSDLGDSWSPVMDTLADIWTANGVRYAQKKWASGDETLLQSTDHGATWAPLSEPAIGQRISALSAKGNRIVAATWNDEWDYSTTDRGNSWTRLGRERVNLNVSSLAFCGPYLIAGGTSTDGGIDISSDNGSTWTRVTNGSDAQIEYLAVNSPYVFASGNGMWVSTDCGLTWATRNTGLRSGTPYLGAMAMVNGKLFVAENGGYWGDSVFVSSDRGSSWRPAGRLGWSLYVPVSSLLTEGGALFAGTGDPLGRGNGIWKSTDDGKTWTQTVTGLGDSVVLDLAASRGTIFAGTQDKGVFASTDAGESWMPASDGLSCPHINRLLVHGQDLYAGTINEGVWRRPLSELTGVHALRLATPSTFRLGQNYPNPFNPSTTITFELPKSSDVRLTVFDLLGREVAVLVNERREAGGHAATFDASALSSGVYVYRLEAGGAVLSRKCLLLK